MGFSRRDFLMRRAVWMIAEKVKAAKLSGVATDVVQG
jgi:hypothetical protein